MSVELIFGAEIYWVANGCVCHKQVYSMDVGRLGDVLVVGVVICAMRLGYIQAWRFLNNF